MRVFDTLLGLAHRRALNKLVDDDGHHTGFAFMNSLREYFEVTLHHDNKKLMIVMISPNGDKQSALVSVSQDNIRSFHGLRSWNNYDPVNHSCTVASVTIDSFLKDIELNDKPKNVNSWRHSGFSFDLSNIIADDYYDAPYLPSQPEPIPEPIEIRIDAGRGYYVADRSERRRTEIEQEIIDADSVRRSREISRVEMDNYNFMSSETLCRLREYFSSEQQSDRPMVQPQELRENERWYHQHDTRRLRF